MENANCRRILRIDRHCVDSQSQLRHRMPDGLNSPPIGSICDQTTIEEWIPTKENTEHFTASTRAIRKLKRSTVRALEHQLHWRLVAGLPTAKLCVATDGEYAGERAHLKALIAVSRSTQRVPRGPPPRPCTDAAFSVTLSREPGAFPRSLMQRRVYLRRKRRFGCS